MATVHKELVELVEQTSLPEIDSRYRLIILAAQRSKQLQRSAHPRIALEEVIQGTIPFQIATDGD